MPSTSKEERTLLHELLTQPFKFEHRYTSQADCELRRTLFKSLAKHRDDYLRLFFPNGIPIDQSQPWSLRKAQGAEEGAEYTAAAKGTACGHIFRSGESTYHCKTCAADDTCVLCAKCFESSDHEDHMVFISVSPGNSGCCDCGDREAWRKEVQCSIHTAGHDSLKQMGKEKAPVGSLGSQLPADLVESIRMTIARVVDYLCDVFSCSPEQLRLPKTEITIRNDERLSRLGGIYGEEPVEQNPEFALVLWNDEKHTVDDVQNQVARACRQRKSFGFTKAMEVNDIGRSVIKYSHDVQDLLACAEVIEQIKVTVTIRSARDTFREQMCATIIDWIADISGCAVGNDPHILRNIVCEELLKPWRTGSLASNKDIGQAGIDDHETEENDKLRRHFRQFIQPLQPAATVIRVEVETDDNADDDDNDEEENEDDEAEFDDMDVEEEGMDVEVGDLSTAANATIAPQSADAANMDIDFFDENEGFTEGFNTALARYPPPPLQASTTGHRRRILTPTDSDDGEPEQPRPVPDVPYSNLPQTPMPKNKIRPMVKRPITASKHWREKPEGFKGPRPPEPCEDLWQRVRLDFLILYDLRLWKVLRISLRHLYITTVVTIPHFKRILGLRFAGLYTNLAQLYLIADREPDHSIINLSVQMLTTPTITQEVVERGNFLTNLMAILYTFLTTRQVGFPTDVNPKATLAFDAGAVTNRRMFHFFLDLRWLFQSEFIQFKMRTEQRYLLQFIDLVKLHQGLCPNIRATGEHVEYESDAWISASMIVKEINKLCKQAAKSFEPKPEANDHNMHLQRALRTVAQITMINSFGYERKRFIAAELKDDLAWHDVGPFEDGGTIYSVPSCVVQSEPMSFHHPLHYLLSWLIEHGKDMSRDEMRSLLNFSPDDLKDPWNSARPAAAPRDLTPDQLLCAIFDHPLRTYVWLAQMKAGMWVRNGITLRHQAHTYRSVNHRDVGYQRDIFMIQTGLAICGAENERPGERFLAQIIDRFQMNAWFKGDYSIVQGFDDSQQLDVIEDMFHLLVIALSERGNLVPNTEGREQNDRVLEHDIAHALCFKPLSFSDLASRVTDKVGESDDFNRVLENMTVYRAPEGLSDTGTFELKQEFISLVDPYYAHYSRNHREESEAIYKKYMSQKTGKAIEDIVYEPSLLDIPSGLFAGLAAFTNTPLFVQVLCAALNFAAGARAYAPTLQATRVETFLHMVLHLIMIATIEDKNTISCDGGFIKLAMSSLSRLDSGRGETVVSLLVSLSSMDDYASCHPTIRHILKKMQSRHPEKLGKLVGSLDAFLDRKDTGSPASLSAEDKEKKKQEALARQARVMAKMKEQQNTFMQSQGLSAFGAELDDFDDMSVTEEPECIERKTWSYPTGTCILCQEETDDHRLFGTFAFLGESNILRSTPTDDPDFVKEVIDTPPNLDRPAEAIRPFGVAGSNKRTVEKITSDGQIIVFERQGLSKGFPRHKIAYKGPVSTSCAHIMHYSCFEMYLTATSRRHLQPIARNHPERIELKEFICPLCKALGNTFLPVIWKAKECAYEHELHAAKNFSDWLVETVSGSYTADLSFLDDRNPEALHRQAQMQEIYTNRSSQHVAKSFAPSLVASMQELTLETSSPTASSSENRFGLRRGYSLSSLFRLGRHNSESSIEPGYSTQNEQTPRMAELVSAYIRIEQTIRQNKLGKEMEHRIGSTLSIINPIQSLSRALGLTVSAFEIAHRATGKMLATSLINDLSEQTLTHLRILSETIESFLAINVLRHPNGNIAARETARMRDVMTAQLFGVDSDIAMIKIQELDGLLFQDDIFLFFADWLSLMAPDVAEASEILQLCYWGEITKAVFVYKKIVKQFSPSVTSAAKNMESSRPFDIAVSAMAINDMRDPYARFPLSQLQLEMLRTIVDRYALTFLRKSIVLMHVRYGLDFECPYNIDPEAPELERLTNLLHVSSIDQFCTLYNSHGAGADRLREFTKRWISQASMITEHEPQGSPSINMSHPAIFELVGLPKNYDTLTEEAIKRKCPTTGKEITDPAICLFCGDIFCSQAVCCMKDKNKGGCYQHMQTCGGKVGLFINIRKCMVLFMHGPGNGSWAHAPYLDKHGEPDPTLRRHHQLYLNQRRYDKLLRDVWLTHMIPTVISRKLEADINTGGWETL